MKSLLSPTGMPRHPRLSSHRPVQPPAHGAAFSPLPALIICVLSACPWQTSLALLKLFLCSFSQVYPHRSIWLCQNSSHSSRSHCNLTSSRKPSHILPQDMGRGHTAGTFLLPAFLGITLYSPQRSSLPSLIPVIRVRVWLYLLMVGPWRSRLHLVHFHILHGIWKSALHTVGTLNGIVLRFLIRTAGHLPVSLHLLFIPDSSFLSVV